MSVNSINARFKDAPWVPTEGEDFEVIIGGAGGIGSWLTLFLSRAGYQCHVYDFDFIEGHNLGGQMYNYPQIGKDKVDALHETCNQYTDMKISVFKEKYVAQSMTTEHMFSAFDNMEARKVMVENWYRDNKDNPNAIFIDGRLIMEKLEVFCVTPSTFEAYHKDNIFPDSDVEDAPCTMKQTTHVAAMIAGFMTSFYTNHVANVKSENTARDIPYRTEYFVPLNMFETC
jgi:molybdopterin/thiamine biosynthesis adenylyltransferase